MEDNKWVYVFELEQKDLKEIMGGKFSLTEIGLPVIIKNSDKNGHLMPVGFLEKRWTYSAPALAALLELEGDKVVRISDEGKIKIQISKYQEVVKKYDGLAQKAMEKAMEAEQNDDDMAFEKYQDEEQAYQDKSDEFQRKVDELKDKLSG